MCMCVVRIIKVLSYLSKKDPLMKKTDSCNNVRGITDHFCVCVCVPLTHAVSSSLGADLYLVILTVIPAVFLLCFFKV